MDENKITKPAQTSAEVSAIAARLMNINIIQIKAMDYDQLTVLLRDVRKVAASALRQDETKGKR